MGTVIGILMLILFLGMIAAYMIISYDDIGTSSYSTYSKSDNEWWDHRTPEEKLRDFNKMLDETPKWVVEATETSER